MGGRGRGEVYGDDYGRGMRLLAGMVVFMMIVNDSDTGDVGNVGSDGSEKD